MSDRIATPFLALAAALTLATAAPAQDTGTPDDSRLVHPGYLTVGTSDPVYPPWMMNDSPESGEGFENALVYALAGEMGFTHDQVQWVRLTFEQIIAPGDKPFDFAINQVCTGFQSHRLDQLKLEFADIVAIRTVITCRDDGVRTRIGEFCHQNG